ncbi:hypothetical protein ADL15_37940 [Actinoplanes awajinensis subsp. mycoplanecinus]|uniref:Uncharacterized protein n=1 Tax=Actinoplanes awajinensis subsp. mycoplanecinus TaxID=135947 RepID=A0A101JGR4_9ACTN|nr:hypothetical protein ADL15_37940 [Actinoplanes awajinensis subsp. mycoplanecinus]
MSVGIMAAGALLLAPAAAQAGLGSSGAGQDGITQITSTNLGALNGTQFAMPVNAPMNMNGNALALGGISKASGTGVNRVAEGSYRKGGSGINQASGGNVGFLNGTQIAVPVTVPVNMNGNADSLFGISSAQGGGVNRIEGGQVAQGGHGGGISQSSGGNVGFLNGTQIAVPITIPINQCGNSTSIFGISSAQATCGNFIGATGRMAQVSGGQSGHSGQAGQCGQCNGGSQGGWGHGNNGGNHWGHGNDRGSWGHGAGRDPWGHGWDSGINQSSFGSIGFLNGTQFAAPIIAPINVCGNSFGGLFGASSASAVCVNRIGDDGGHWVKPAKGHGHGHVKGDKNCTCKDKGDKGGVRGDNGYKGEKPAAVNDDKGYSNKTPVDVNDDDNGYGDDVDDTDTGDVKGDKGYGDVKGDKGDKGYGDVKDDKYGDKTGGRKTVESASVSNLTGSLGGLDLLDSLR